MLEVSGTVESGQPTVSSRRRSGSAARIRRGAVGVRVTPDERSRLASLAADAGAKSVADYLRKVGLARVGSVSGRRGAPRDPGTAEALRRVAGALGSIGNNANQIARACNVSAMAGETPSPDVGGLLEVAAALDRIRADVRAALGVEAVGDGA